MKKFLSMLLMCAVIVSMSGVSAFAAENVEIMPSGYGTGSTGTMNSVNGAESKQWPVTILSSAGAVTSVALNVTVSSGSDPMYVYVESPEGQKVSRLISKSSSLTFDEFKGKKAAGKWYVSIKSTGLVSTATARLTVNYE